VAAAQIARKFLAVDYHLLHGRSVYKVNIQKLVRVTLITRILSSIQLRRTAVSNIRVAAEIRMEMEVE